MGQALFYKAGELNYFIQGMDNEKNGRMFRDFNEQTPYFIVHVDRGVSATKTSAQMITT